MEHEPADSGHGVEILDHHWVVEGAEAATATRGSEDTRVFTYKCNNK
jgi:hypothetical protein